MTFTGMPDRNIMGLFDEDLDAASNDDVTWLEATLRTSIEPQDWPYWGTRLIKRIRSHEQLVQDLLEAMHEAAIAAHKIGSRGEHYGNCEGCQRDKRRDALLAQLEESVPADVQVGDGGELES